ncbi:hypothetical protein RINTU1_23420 [Candidatus Regiella insecticola]|uniref:Uncharacterized protein n=1 Tax=Candidatus Regiella insecticola TaxID=138073 RepID=A0A6L2ZPB9_9ENTR|nr:hypothetical protein RINTU1_22680 [Candidatus Regiella insecticola]GFN46643.1 hypothetical protein RINTU1_23420 [Candidatus Regiella insecticola]
MGTGECAVMLLCDIEGSKSSIKANSGLDFVFLWKNNRKRGL